MTEGLPVAFEDDAPDDLAIQLWNVYIEYAPSMSQFSKLLIKAVPP